MVVAVNETKEVLKGLFRKWNSSDDQVSSEPETPILYSLHFRNIREDSQGRKRWTAYFGDISLCSVYANEKEEVERLFNEYKAKNMSILEIRLALQEKYNVKDKSQTSGKEYAFWEKNANSYIFALKNGTRKEEVCYFNKSRKEEILKEYLKLKEEGKTFEEIKEHLSPLYAQRKRGIKKEKSEKKTDKIPLKWDSEGYLLFYGKNTCITPSKLSMIQTLHANAKNPFFFGDYVLQNVPNALPSAIFYICSNYDKIPFNDLIKEGINIQDELWKKNKR